MRHPAAASAAALYLLLLCTAPAVGQDQFATPAGQNDQRSLTPDFAPAGAAEPSSQFGLAAGVGAPQGELRLKYQGVATVAFSPDPITPYGAVGLGCGLGFVSPTFQSNYVGVSPDIFLQAAACGRCITIQCDDTSCTAPGSKQLPALVAGLCGSCTRNDLAIAEPLFRNLTGRTPGSSPSVTVSWDVTSCTPYTQGAIKMLVKSGGSAFFQAFGFSNSMQPITAVQINGQRTKHGTDNYWSWNPGKPIEPSTPLDIALLGANRQVLRARVPSLRSADLGVQFKPS